MKKYITIERLLILGLVVLIIIFGVDSCKNQDYEGQVGKIDSLTLANQRLDSTVSKLGDKVFTQESLVVDQQSLINDLTDSIFGLKKADKKNRDVIAYYQGRTNTGVAGIEIPYLDTISMKRFSDSVEARCSEVLAYMRDSTIQVPKEARDSTQHYDISLIAKKTTITATKVSFPDTLDLAFTEKRFLLKKPEIQIQFKHSNPYVKTLGANSVTYRPKSKPRLLERAVLIGLGIVAGIYITK